MQTTWTETRLWNQLASSSSPEKENISGLLHQWMPTIETVLNAGTSPLDFTLHDEEHSFRVAEWMAKIVPEEVLPQLSAYELALLLLSAYLHDIGMTPEQARVQRHWRHLVFGPVPAEEGGLSPKEADDFQRWLDDERGGLVPPLAAQGGGPTEDDLHRATEVITYYARHKHNDWSGEWIRRNATGALGSYEGWIEDLVRLCQSHHGDYNELEKPSFDPRPVGRHDEVVHLRYLACVLRVADILDVDPERTPPVLFQHRGIAHKSIVYWWKDHDFKVSVDGSTLVVHARPRSAVLEKAVRDTAEWIRLELEICARLGREKPFSHASFRTSRPLPHKWSFPESLLLQIRPTNDDYVYIDGAFRPNTAKLLELLSGIQLYKEPLAAVRELLQNAFDAVKEQIALERLEGDPQDEKRTDAIIALQSVELRFEERDGRFWLVCTDSGVGMTRSIIERYLLVSGSSRRHDILELERRCEAAGFNLGRTGQFGIGVLSYFMLADRVEIRTRRSTARRDAETFGWKFQTEGVGTFGELRKDSQGRAGTTVGLRLRPGLVPSSEEFLARLRGYLFGNLLYLPCGFKFFVGEAEDFRLATGWQTVEKNLEEDYLCEIEQSLREWLREVPVHIPRSYTEKSYKKLEGWPDVVKKFKSSLRWESEAGTLPGGIGSYRISVPFFDLPGGRSGLFFNFDSKNRGLARRIPLLSWAISLGLQPNVRTSFHGIGVQSKRKSGELLNESSPGFLCEIDWLGHCAGQISVDRDTFSLTAEAAEAFSWLEVKGKELQASVLSAEPSEYRELDARMNPLISLPAEAWWFSNAVEHDGLIWERISFPAVSSSALEILGKAVEARNNCGPVFICRSFSVYFGKNSSGSFEWGVGRRSEVSPDRVAIVSAEPLVIIPLFSIGGCRAKTKKHVLTGEFPQGWRLLAALGSNRAGDPWLWNRDHPLIEMIEAQDFEWSVGHKRWQLSDDLLQTRGRSALHVMSTLESLDPAVNKELAEDFRAGFWSDLWDSLALKSEEIISWVQQADGEGFLWILNRDGLERIPSTDPRIPQYLPDPGDEWKLTITYASELSGAP